jgi:hypothetical protein
LHGTPVGVKPANKGRSARLLFDEAGSLNFKESPYGISLVEDMARLTVIAKEEHPEASFSATGMGLYLPER